MFIQGKWLYDADILCLNHVTKPTVAAFSQEVFRTPKLAECSANTLAGMRFASIHHEHVLQSALINIYGTRNAGDIMKSVKGLPWVQCSLTITQTENSESAKHVKLIGAKIEPVRLLAGGEYDFTFTFTKKGRDDGLAVQSPRFPKKKDESWFLLLGTSDDELIGIKRTSIRRKTCTSVKVTLPDILGNFVYTAYLLSDSYLGMDQQYDIPLHVTK